MAISFTKMHGAGNDFVMINGLDQTLPQNMNQLSKRVCDRHFGIGADQVLVVMPSDQADYKMLIYNADGGEVEMCGNGIRCFVKMIRDLKLSDKSDFTIETLGGVKRPVIIDNHPKTTAETSWVCVDMGEPVLEAEKIPFSGKTGLVVGEAWNDFFITTVSMGNPHCVIFVDDLGNYPVSVIGPRIETDPQFPERTNVEFVQILNKGHVMQRTWERGSGETLACGTGASATAVALVLNGLGERDVIVSLRGGDLELKWDEKTNHVYKTGPATTVFEGAIGEEML